MNKIKVIDLLNMISKGEEVPKEIKYRDWLYEFKKSCNDYLCQYDSLLYRENDDVRQFLNDTVEIIEEEKKITPKDFENLGYALGSIKKYINKGYDKAIEEKKIPEKLDVIGWDKCIHNVTHKEKELAIEINKTQKLLNQLIDYLKSKGDE